MKNGKITVAIDAANWMFKLARIDVANSMKQWGLWMERLAKAVPGKQVVCIDGKGSLRREWLSSYKANRPQTDLRDLVRETLGQVVERCLYDEIDVLLAPDGYEADDLLALVADRTVENDGQCVIASSDKDLRQCLLHGRVSICRQVGTYGNSFQSDFLTAAKLVEETKLQPDQWRDYLTLVGDSTDNVPGCPRIGEKTATDLLVRMGTLDEAAKAPAFALPLTNKVDMAFRIWAKDPNGMALSRKLVSLYPPPSVNWEPSWA